MKMAELIKYLLIKSSFISSLLQSFLGLQAFGDMRFKLLPAESCNIQGA